MPIEVRFDPDGKGSVVIPCVHCGGDIEDVDRGVAVWVPARKPRLGEHHVFAVDYAHEDCEESFLRRQASPDAMRLGEKTNAPLGEFLEMLRGVLNAPRHPRTYGWAAHTGGPLPRATAPGRASSPWPPTERSR